MSKLLAGDRPRDLAFVVSVFVAYAVIDRWVQSLVSLTEADLGRFSLVAASAGSRWWLFLLLAAAGALAVVLRPQRMLARWTDLEHGRVLRGVAAALILLLAWQTSLYEYNYVAREAHMIDRLLVATLGIGAVYRPVLIVPFAVVVRIVNEQFLYPFGTAAAQNVDELLVVSLLALAAGHLVFVITGRADTSPILLLLGAAVAAHFYLPGKGKLDIGWFGANDVSNLPLSSHTAGWLGQTDGGFSQALADGYARFDWPTRVATLVIELGAVVAVFHPRLLRVFLPAWLAFHAMTFATTGFFFLSWAVLELALLAILVWPTTREWVAENATPARGLVAVAAVLGSSVLFHPPGLAWLDAPVSYGYEVEAIGESGASYHVPLSAFAPFDQDLSFMRVELGDAATATAGYGALDSTAALAELEGVTSFEELAAYEATLDDPALTDTSERFIESFFRHANGDSRLRWFGLDPPDRFWTGREEPRFDFDEPLQRLDVFLVRSLHNDGDPVSQRELVFSVEADTDRQDG